MLVPRPKYSISLLAVACVVGCRWEYEDLSGALDTGSALDGSLGGEDGDNPQSFTGGTSAGGAIGSGGGAPGGGSASMGGEPSSSGGSAAGGTGEETLVCDPCASGERCFLGSCLPVRRVFLTSTRYPANFGSAAGASAECQAVADGQGLGGAWLAWIADGVTSPASSFPQNVGPYVLLNDTVVAADFADLSDANLALPIDRDESGALTIQREVWTGTDSTGNPTGEDCNNWKSAAAAQLGTQGVSDQTSSSWTDIYFQFCDRVASLYCFEQ